MSSPTCIRLPFLHEAKTIAPQAASLRFFHLWPGLPEMGRAYWLPDNYPFAPEQANRIMAQLGSLAMHELETMRQTHNARQYAGDARLLEELAALSGFAESGVNNLEDGQRELKLRLLLEQAQKALLWLWVQEERMAEISALSRKCDDFSEMLAGSFGEGETGALHERAGHSGEEMQGAASSLLPPWRICVTNAAVFIPPEMPILAEGEMARDVLELLEFSPSAQGAGFSGALHEARAPLWRIVGHGRPVSSGSSHIDNIYNLDRSWLVWKE